MWTTLIYMYVCVCVVCINNHSVKERLYIIDLYVVRCREISMLKFENNIIKCIRY